MSSADTNGREPEVIDGETGKPDPSPEADRLLGRGYLSTLRDVRIAIAKVIRGEVAGTLEHNRARGLVWMLRQLGEVIEVADLERRQRILDAQLRDLESATEGTLGRQALPRPERIIQ